MKLYKVPLYQVNYTILHHGEIEYLEDIIVFKKLFGVKEVLTGYSNIDFINHSLLEDGILKFYFRNEKRFQDTGYHLIVLEDDFTSKRRVSLEELNQYVEEFDHSLWNKIYHDMKVLKKDEKNKIKRRTREIFQSKK